MVPHQSKCGPVNAWLCQCGPVPVLTSGPSTSTALDTHATHYQLWWQVLNRWTKGYHKAAQWGTKVYVATLYRMSTVLRMCRRSNNYCSSQHSHFRPDKWPRDNGLSHGPVIELLRHASWFRNTISCIAYDSANHRQRILSLWSQGTKPHRWPLLSQATRRTDSAHQGSSPLSLECHEMCNVIRRRSWCRFHLH
jgi:hypothetical protein